MKILNSKKVQIGLLIFLIIGLVQSLNFSYNLANQPDTYLFNLGVLLVGISFGGIIYSVNLIIQLLTNKSK
jgi:uncharacterized membrane protein YczE